MKLPEVGSIWVDDRDEIFMRVDDPNYPWRFLNSLEDGGVAEPRDADFPHLPLVRMRADARVGVISE